MDVFLQNAFETPVTTDKKYAEHGATLGHLFDNDPAAFNELSSSKGRAQDVKIAKLIVLLNKKVSNDADDQEGGKPLAIKGPVVPRKAAEGLHIHEDRPAAAVPTAAVPTGAPAEPKTSTAETMLTWAHRFRISVFFSTS